jgi:hypothetical protein
MVIHSPYLEWDHRNIMHYPNAKEGIFERFRDTMAPVVKRAEAVGTTLMLENISDIDPNFRVELAKSFEPEALQISVDTGHAQIEDVLASLKISGKLRLSETERTTLVTQIQAIAAFAEQHRSCLVELDVNPIILDTAGRATAVDALLRLAQE